MQQPFQYTASQQNKEPPPYPGHVFARGFQHNAGYRQSYASSETGSTDLSLSSCENLSMSLRQDPQGEETQHANILPGSVELHQPTYQDHYVQSSATGVEVRTTNSSTFYVTGSVSNQTESPHMSTYTAVSPASNLPGSERFSTGLPEQEPFKPYQQSYQNQYYSSLNSSGQHPSRQLSVQQSSDHQSPDHVPNSRHLQNPGQEPKCVQNVQYQQQGEQQYLGVHDNLSDPVTDISISSQCKKQDHFKKWRHFYVNDKTSLQQYREFSEDSERISQDEEGTTGRTSDQSGTHHTEHSRLQLDKSKHYDRKPLRSLEDCPSSSFGSGSMIAKLRQEFCKDNPPDHRYNSISKTKDTSERRGQCNRSNDRIRSATPDFLSDHSEMSKHLPLRPSSANSRQTSSQRQNLPFESKPENQTVNNRSKSVSHNQNKSPDGVRKHTLSLLNQEDKLQEGTNESLKQSLIDTSQKGVSSQGNCLENQNHSNPRVSQWKNNSDVDVERNSSCHCASKDTVVLGRDSGNGVSGAGPQTEILNSVMSPSMRSQPVRDKYDQAGDRADRNSLDRSRASELDHAAIATRATQMVERLSAENSSLRQELEGYYSKVCRLQKFEVEIQKITDAYESLVKHSTKRENLDKVMRLRLETEVKKLRENNQDLKDQLEKTLSKVDQCGGYALSSDNDVKKEVREKDAMITKLIIQSRELSKSRDKLEVELATQKACCEEHQNHVQVLEDALKLAHADKFNLQGELQKLTVDENKMQQLQQALGHLKSAAEKRESIEHRLRGKLEEEIRTLKNQKEFAQKASDTDEGIASDCESGPRVNWMKQQIRELSESVLRLEVEVAHYQQCYIEEQALRELALNTVAVPKDVKIAALEQNSQETERLISECKTERLQHLEELYNANRKSAEFEAKVKTLEAQLGEKEAMIRVLEKHALSLSRTSSVNSLFSPVHSSHQSSTSARGTLPISPVLPHRDLNRLAVHHAKSSSDGAMLDLSGIAASNTLCSKTESKQRATKPVTVHTTGKSLRQLLTAQAELFQRWKTEDPEDLSKECWQV